MAAKLTGRVTGTLLLVQLAGLIVPFVLLLPLGRDFLTTAAPAARSIRAAVILLFANGGLTIGLSLVVGRILRGGSATGPLWLVAAAVMMCVLQTVDNAFVLSMLTVSDRFASVTAPDETLRVAGDAIRTIRQWMHTMAILAIDVWLASFYVLLHRRGAVPRVLTAFGLGTTGLHSAGIPIRSLFGHGPLATLGMPMALGHLALAIWLIVNGLPPEPSRRQVEIRRPGPRPGRHQERRTSA